MQSYHGTKSVVISTVSWIGGKNPFLGWAYVATAALFVFLAIAGTIRHMLKPRCARPCPSLSYTSPISPEQKTGRHDIAHVEPVVTPNKMAIYCLLYLSAGIGSLFGGTSCVLIYLSTLHHAVARTILTTNVIILEWHSDVTEILLLWVWFVHGAALWLPTDAVPSCGGDPSTFSLFVLRTY